MRERGDVLPIVFVGPNTGHLGDGPAPGFRTPYVEEVQATLRTTGLQLGRDYFALGYVTDLEIQALLRLATAFVCPSTYEGFGLPGLEAMRARAPCSSRGSRHSRSRTGFSAVAIRMFDPKDPEALAAQLGWVLSHPGEVTAAATALAERVGDVYDWRRTARAYLLAFDELVTTSRQASHS